MKKITILLCFTIFLLLTSCTHGPSSSNTSTLSNTTTLLESSSESVQPTQTSKPDVSSASTTSIQNLDIEQMELLVREEIERQYPEILRLQRFAFDSSDPQYKVTKIDVYRQQYPDKKVTITDEGILKHFFPVRIQGVYTTEPGFHSRDSFIYDIYCGEKVLSFELKNDRSIAFSGYEDKVFVTKDKIDSLAVSFLEPSISYPDDAIINKMASSRILKQGDTTIFNDNLILTLMSEFDKQKVKVGKPSIDTSQPIEDLILYFGGETYNMKFYKGYVSIDENSTHNWYKVTDVEQIINAAFLSIP
jgi:hypothetical protein